MNSNRGMKKWAPFSSLVEQSEYLDKMHYQKNKISKPKISNERAEKIDNFLHNFKNRLFEIDYYYDGYIYTLKREIKRVDALNKQLIFQDGNLPFSAIVDMREINN